jgi:hypothetical protein
MDFDYLHEAEDVVLQSDTYRPCTPLWTMFTERGFTLYQDVFALDRPKKPRIPVWQSETIVSVHVFSDDKEIYEPEDQWNRVVLTYLLATQPRIGIPVFARQASEISAHLGLPMMFRGKIVALEELEKHLNRFADELTARLGEPGSEDVAILIQLTYPRKRT